MQKLKGQKKKIIDYLKTGKAISARVAAVDLGITQLSSRIGELEHKGYQFNRRTLIYRDKNTEAKVRYMEYSL